MPAAIQRFLKIAGEGEKKIRALGGRPDPPTAQNHGIHEIRQRQRPRARYVTALTASALPPHKEGTGLTEYLSFYFTHEGDVCSQIVRDVSKSIVVKIPSVKREVTAYAVVNGHVAGEAGEPVPRKKAVRAAE